MTRAAPLKGPGESAQVKRTRAHKHTRHNHAVCVKTRNSKSPQHWKRTIGLATLPVPPYKWPSNPVRDACLCCSPSTSPAQSDERGRMWWWCRSAKRGQDIPFGGVFWVIWTTRHDSDVTLRRVAASSSSCGGGSRKRVAPPKEGRQAGTQSTSGINRLTRTGHRPPRVTEENAE